MDIILYNLKLFLIILITIFTFSHRPASAQVHKGSDVLKWATWAALQSLPSITYFNDNNKANSRVQFGLRWHITPFNYSFNANSMVSPVQFFKVNPVRRFSGSVELFAQPEWTTNSYRYADLKRFALSTGARVFIPLVESGEYLAFSAGGKYSFRKTKSGSENNTSGIELGMYSFYGMLGVQFNYNFNSTGRYNVGLYFKYY